MPIRRQHFLKLRTSDPETYQGMTELLNYVEQLALALGVEPQAAAQVTLAQAVSPPLPASAFQVTGSDGYFRLTVTNNSKNLQPVLHEVASATTLNFDATAGVTVYGPDTGTHWTIADPNVAKYWRLRSKFLNSAFNSPTYFTNNGTSAPLAVSSGVLRLVSASGRLQHTANYLTAFAEYVASGSTLANGDTSDGTPTIDWAAGRISKDGGATSVSVPKTTIRGLTANTTYVLAWDTGSSLARYATDGGSILSDNNIYIGTVVTPSAVGGGSSSAGGGSNGVGVTSGAGRYAYT